MTFTFIDLFSGIGGFHQAAAMEGGKCLFACEKNARAREIYQTVYGIEPHLDILTAPIIQGADMLFAGPPCQSFSSIGNRGGTEDPRGSLIYATASYILAAQPKAFIIENVKGLLRYSGFERLIKMLENDGLYQVKWYLLDAGDFGVPQHRERIYIIGHLGETTGTLKECGYERIAFEKIADKKLDSTLLTTKFDSIIKKEGLLDIHTSSGFVLRARKNNYINNKLFSTKGTVGTLCATFIPYVYDELHRVIRRMSIREMCLCQGFPATFEKQFRGRTEAGYYLGNAVCVPVIHALIQHLIPQFKRLV